MILNPVCVFFLGQIFAPRQQTKTNLKFSVAGLPGFFLFFLICQKNEGNFSFWRNVVTTLLLFVWRKLWIVSFLQMLSINPKPTSTTSLPNPTSKN
jgi:hypothetical protein